MSYNQDTQSYEFYSKVDLPVTEDDERLKRKNKVRETKKVSSHTTYIVVIIMFQYLFLGKLLRYEDNYEFIQ